MAQQYQDPRPGLRSGNCLHHMPQGQSSVVEILPTRLQLLDSFLVPGKRRVSVLEILKLKQLTATLLMCFVMVTSSALLGVELDISLPLLPLD